jgi:hypothetical protein
VIGLWMAAQAWLKEPSFQIKGRKYRGSQHTGGRVVVVPFDIKRGASTRLGCGSWLLSCQAVGFGA